MELRKDVLDAIMRTVQQSDRDAHFGPLNKIYGKDVVDYHVIDLIETHLIDGRIVKGISPPKTEFIVLGLTPAGRRYFGVAPSSSGASD